MRCTESQINKIAASKPHRNSNCPNTIAWMSSLLRQSLKVQSPTVISVGCNKGDDFVSDLRDWSSNKFFSVEQYNMCLKSEFPRLRTRACAATPRGQLAMGDPRSVNGICIEPMPSNFKMLQRCFSKLGYLHHATLKQVAVSSSPGTAPFPDGVNGVENLGLDVNGAAAPLVEVNVTTIDHIVAKQDIKSIDVLSIDTEGHACITTCRR
eukprot:626672-Hanusia_phi.AAC.1